MMEARRTEKLLLVLIWVAVVTVFLAGVQWSGAQGVGIQSARDTGECRARDAAGKCLSSPDQPGNIKVTPICETQRSISVIPFHRYNQITWNSVEEATSYKVYRARPTDNDWTLLKEIGGNPPTTVHKDGPYPSPGINTDWYYTVTAVMENQFKNFQGESLRENFVFQEGYQDSCPGEEAAPPLPMFTPAPITEPKPKASFSISATAKCATTKEVQISKGSRATLCWSASSGQGAGDKKAAVCQPTSGSESGSFRGLLKDTDTATTAILDRDSEFKIECWGTNELGARVTEIAKETVKSKMVASDLIASIPTAKWVRGPKSGKENLNTFAEGAVVKLSVTVQNTGTADSPKSKATWRGTKGATSVTKVTDFETLEPIEGVAGLGKMKSVTLSRDTPPLPLGQFQFGGCADASGDANELDEKNNCSPEPLTIAVVTPQNPATPVTTSTPAGGKGWDGWIKLSGTAKEGSPYGIRYDPFTTRFCGYAWGGEVVGWIEFGPLPDENAHPGWICDQTRTVDKDRRISAPPYRVVPGTDSGDWVRLANTTGTMIETEERIDRLPKDIQLYDGTRTGGSPYKLFGWAWSPNIGWISMSSDNLENDSGMKYSVAMVVRGDDIDTASGRNLIGHAWSPHLGWIKFDAVPNKFYDRPGTTGREVYPASPQKPTYLNIKGVPNDEGVPANRLGGWARVCSATVNGDCDSPTGDYDGH